MNRFLQKQLSRSINTNTKILSTMSIKWYRKPEIIIPTILSVILTAVVMYQTYELSLKNQSIQGFDTLLKYSRAQIDTLNSNQKLLTEQLAVLNEQLTLNRNMQHEANILSEYNETADYTRFYTAVIKMGTVMDVITPPRKNENWNGEEVAIFIREIEPLLNGQLSNPYLVKNKPVFNTWNNALEHVQLYTDARPWGDGFGDGFGGRVKSNADKITTVPIERDIQNCWIAVNKAFESATAYLKGNVD